MKIRVEPCVHESWNERYPEHYHLFRNIELFVLQWKAKPIYPLKLVSEQQLL